ncbi:extensin family protein [Tsuneonella sp. YG55]|uniref:Extensin family protein n=1 Tax=Tsuneonella litorea TaxID=2976475 RepID=A0A9X2VZY4_9SPHN|nr:extensin family protein [Tsuneonella litorea]MCT2558088.1 extensin family protein [Tsuneonella litorea]
MTPRKLLGIARRWRPSRFDRIAFAALVLASLVLAGKGWLDTHPEANPWAPLTLSDPDGWATRHKLAGLREDGARCRAILERTGVAHTVLPPTGEGACRRPDRVALSGLPLNPRTPPATCAVAAGLVRWIDTVVRPAARETLGSPLARIEHLGAYSCRRLYGRASGRWSEHATGNAIDVTAFVLADGRRISVLEDWSESGPEARFLHRVRTGACQAFGTVLSPDYNAAHRDHLHLDQQTRGWSGVCR